MLLFFRIAYFVIGFAQLFAIVDGIEYATGIGGVFGFIIAIFTTYMIHALYMPFLGAGLGVYGAVNVWDWSMIQSIVLFFWFVPAFILVAIFTRDWRGGA